MGGQFVCTLLEWRVAGYAFSPRRFVAVVCVCVCARAPRGEGGRKGDPVDKLCTPLFVCDTHSNFLATPSPLISGTEIGREDMLATAAGAVLGLG